MFNKNVNDNRINERMERKLYNYLKGRNKKKGHIIDDWIMVNDKVMQTYIYKIVKCYNWKKRQGKIGKWNSLELYN